MLSIRQNCIKKAGVLFSGQIKAKKRDFWSQQKYTPFFILLQSNSCSKSQQHFPAQKGVVRSAWKISQSGRWISKINNKLLRHCSGKIMQSEPSCLRAVCKVCVSYEEEG